MGQVRTIGALVTMNGVLAAGVGAGAVLGRRRGRNLTVGPAFDAALAVAGVRVNATGTEHLRAPRPAIFAFNHQSNLDPLVVFKLVRRDFTSTGKAEVRKDPAAAFTAYAIDAVLIDRKDPEKARAQMEVAAQRLLDGDSVLIAPEGTRNMGPEPGAYKTGTIHLAITTRAPIIPVILRNTGELMPGRAIAPGTVDVHVHAPWFTDDWKPADARKHAAALQEQATETIRNWPA
ncbi:MAG: putative phosphoserine phosphatase / 1-acylglycerol-3-phosphate O-acyltransferase [Solirubrobacteraceae bacterium]|jgi:1-acyl-sn-glycerol-3-phosphate acyltransferase|nr:putative phosphoserine phosphatase / 1-acylglycerol-3-phosphate O-acyltransferase [Solirubrobacteraceae bacterium]